MKDNSLSRGSFYPKKNNGEYVTVYVVGYFEGYGGIRKLYTDDPN